ncbi:Rieske 2Fe-2S domain-containing protein [Streptomyces sp. NPDC004284]|uniref:Rieske (2Fe-2S) protein n=1 Tax=Streptomyces sp. NPDC004284 TaxID=3364695 RepID=UPI00369D7DC0
MSFTEPQPPASEARADAAREALHDRIAADSLTTRRDYLRIVTTVSGGLAVGGIGVASGILHRHGDSEGAPGVRKIADRIERGESLAFRYPGGEDRAIAVRMEDGTLAGYSAVCTHLACAVLWRKERGSEGELYCPCHEGVFDARTGEVTAGPPPRGLPKVLLVEQLDGSVWAVGTARSGETPVEGFCRQQGDDHPGCPGFSAGAPPRKPAGSDRPPAAAGPKPTGPGPKQAQSDRTPAGTDPKPAARSERP